MPRPAVKGAADVVARAAASRASTHPVRKVDARVAVKVAAKAVAAMAAVRARIVRHRSTAPRA
jgi:hypothetical protein